MKHLELDIEKVHVPDTRVTSYFDAEVYKQFQQTVAALGVLEPVVVVEVGGEYYLVDGLHRLVESQSRGDPQISAVVIPGEEKDIFLTNLFLNVLRGKTKVAQVREVTRVLTDQYKLGVDQIAVKTGLSQDYVNDLLSISMLPKEAVAAFDDGRLAKGKAMALTRLPSYDLQLRAFLQIDGRNMTVQDVEDSVASVLEELGKTPPPQESAAPPAERKLACDGCHQEHKPEELKSLLLCEECAGKVKSE